jgi:hypothetical protein
MNSLRQIFNENYSSYALTFSEKKQYLNIKILLRMKQKKV